jgi:hypothetical protein
VNPFGTSVLNQDQMVEFSIDYRDGAPLGQLATKYQIHRKTVRDLIDRAGLPRRYSRLSPAEVEEAAQLYGSGESLIAIGNDLGVANHTVALALRMAEVEIRMRKWWD